MYMYMREPKVEVMTSQSGTLGIALGVTTVAVLVIGIFPSFLLKLTKAAIAGF
jgi:NADH:ubiquinone oxidoreductase subunit 2 (subunit N)